MKVNVLIIHKGCSVHTWCEDLRLGFAELGHDARAVTLRERSLDERRIELRPGYRRLDNPATIARIAGQVRTHHPSLIIFLNMIGLPGPAHESLRKAAQGAPMIAWLADHVEQMPPGCLPNLDAIHVFDSATLPILQEIYRNTTARLAFLPLAVNPARFPDRGIAWQQRRPSIAFVGNHTKDRLEFIRKLRSHGAAISCYGPRADAGWRFWRGRRISPTATAAIYGSHQLVLNMLQFPNTINGVNLRAYEIPACGGIGTYPDTPDLRESFEPNREIIAYQDAHSLVEKINSLAPEHAATILANSRKRILAEHTYLHRAQSLIS